MVQSDQSVRLLGCTNSRDVLLGQSDVWNAMR